ncbi:MAG: hypothetical protein GKS06_05140 [Acidobacteria bacterium]|nr:hypothetical protein [Acidobacteriota bacterium]
MLKRSQRFALAAFALLLPVSVLAQEAVPSESFAPPAMGVSGGFRLAPPQTGVSPQAPPRDPVGGFALGVLAGVQLRGSASGQFGLTVGWFKRSTSNVGFEFEGAFTRGPDGEVYHGLVNLILQSGSRATRMVPYLAIGGGVFHAKEKLRDSVAAALPEFGIDASEASETGGLIAFGFGVRYYLDEKLSFRADYREMRAITTSSGGFFDRLHSMRRIAGIMMFRF